MLARLDPEAAESVNRSASLADAVTQAVEDKQVAARVKAIAVTDALPEGDRCEVAIDPPALGVLVSNLLDNAIKYTPEGGRVRVGVASRGDRIALQVVNSGPGIPAADRERVMQRFYRRDGASVPGAGLGLSIVQRICELYGAEVSLTDGDDGQGLCVEVVLPSAA